MFEQWLTPTGRLSIKQPQEVRNQWYVQKFQEVHGTYYNYNLVNYVNSDLKVRIICKVHGEFQQRPHDHLRGQDCPYCSGVKLTTKDCIDKFRQLYADKYSYEFVEYINSFSKVKIKCPIHGIFEQRPRDHLSGHGCPSCSSTADVLYIFKCKDTLLTKIGITNNVARRIKQIGNNIVLIQAFKLLDPRKTEKYLHDKYKQYNEYNHAVYNGNTEFFRLTEEQIQDIIEYLNSL